MFERYWTPAERNPCTIDPNGAVHCIGNGRIAVYGQGPDINQVRSPYSSPSALRLDILAESGGDLSCLSRREEGNASWVHDLSIDGRAAASITDFVVAGEKAWVRRVRNSLGGFAFRVRPASLHEAVATDRYGETGWQGISFRILPGNPIFWYPSLDVMFGLLLVRGAATLESKKDEWVIRAENGNFDLLLVLGETLPECVTAAEALVSRSTDTLESDARLHWKRFASRIHTERPMDDDLARIAENTAFLIKCQQSGSGGLPSSYGLPIGYMRDNYGAGRGFLALGLFEEAKAVLEFRFRKWQRFGAFWNAEAMDADYPRHRCDHDEVEHTSYAVLLARDYWRRTHDEESIRRFLPMLSWCLEVQLPLLFGGMLPFNGDETYIAGGILSRDAIEHGAAEASMLFLAAADWLTGWVRGAGCASTLDDVAEAAGRIRAGFREHFVRNGRLMASCPDRLGIAGLPRFRFGVCERGLLSGAVHYGWMERDREGHYVCPTCLETGGPPIPRQTDPVEVPSVALLPAYVDVDLFSAEEMRSFAVPYLDGLPRRRRVVGYDPALLLFALCRTKAPAEQVAAARRMVLEFMDEVGGWNEYYENMRTIPCNRLRPWESGYAVEALLEAAGYEAET